MNVLLSNGMNYWAYRPSMVHAMNCSLTFAPEHERPLLQTYSIPGNSCHYLRDYRTHSFGYRCSGGRQYSCKCHRGISRGWGRRGPTLDLNLGFGPNPKRHCYDCGAKSRRWQNQVAKGFSWTGDRLQCVPRHCRTADHLGLC